MKTSKKVGKATARVKEQKPEISVKTMYFDGINTLSDTTNKRSGKGMHTAKANMKVSATKGKNKENNMWITYKSLNQRITGQISDNKELKRVDINKSVVKEPKTKFISSINFRTKQNSPHKIMSQENELVISIFVVRKFNICNYE